MSPSHLRPRPLVAAVLFGLLVAGVAPAPAGDSKKTTGPKHDLKKIGIPAQQMAKGEADPAAKTKVFRLTHTDPGEVKEILEQLLSEAETAAMADIPVGPGALETAVPMPPVPGAPGGMPPGFGGPAQNLGAGGGFGVAGFGGNQGALGGGLGALGGFGIVGGAGGPVVRVTVHPRTNALVVRGGPKELQVATDLVAVLDLPADKPPPDVKSLRAFRLKHASPHAVAQIIRELDIPAGTVPLGDPKLLLATGSEQVMRELAELVRELDAPAPEAPRKERRKLLREPPEEVP